MHFFKRICHSLMAFIGDMQLLSFIAPLSLRIYLFPIFWMAGIEKFNHITSTAAWFGNNDWGLGLPYPLFMAYLASFTEIFGALALLFGFATRFFSLLLMIVMIVAAVTVHWDNGWLAIASQNSEAHMRLQQFLTWLHQTYPHRHNFLTELGPLVVLNNGVEFAVTYFVMLLNLFFIGAGNYISIDYILGKMFRTRVMNT